MSNHIITAAIAFIVGGIFGGAIVGRIVTSEMKSRLDYLEEQNKKLIDENVSLRDTKIKEKQAKVEKLEKETNLDEYESIRTRYVTSQKSENDETLDNSEKDDPDDDLSDDLSDDLDDDFEDDHSEKIKMISEKRYKDELNYRDNESLTYYQLDGTLVDSSGEIVMKEEEVIGSDIMDIIDETNNDYLYALDEDVDKLYEISIEHDSSYMRDVLGVSGM